MLSIDTTSGRETTRKAFDPIRGKYTVYVFIAVFKGESYNNTEKEFHDIVVLKTGKKGKVLDAYQYTLEWAEMPLTSDLYRATAKGVMLRNGLPVKELKFRKERRAGARKRDLEEPGFLLF
jgi:hypothetical protein